MENDYRFFLFLFYIHKKSLIIIKKDDAFLYTIEISYFQVTKIIHPVIRCMTFMQQPFNSIKNKYMMNPIEYLMTWNPNVTESLTAHGTKSIALFD
jgi:hypothetical protein